MLTPAWIDWPSALPCPREEATIVVTAPSGARLGWDDPTTRGACGRDEPSACSPALAARLDRDGVLTCSGAQGSTATCTWEIAGADFDAARSWTEGPGVTAALRCDADRATGAVFALTESQRAASVTWRYASGTAPVLPSAVGVDPADDAAAVRLADEALASMASALAVCGRVGCDDAYADGLLRSIDAWRAAIVTGPTRPPFRLEAKGWRRELPIDTWRTLSLWCTPDTCGLTDTSRGLLTATAGAIAVGGLLTWHPDGLLIVDGRALTTAPRPPLAPEALAAIGPQPAWTPWRGALAAALPAAALPARADEFLPPEEPRCGLESWRSPAPDLDGDGRADALVRTRLTLGADCAKPTWTLARTYAVSGDTPLATLDQRGGPEEPTEREVTGFVTLPDGRVGLRGTVRHLPCCDQGCTLTGAWVGLVEAGALSVIADTSGACPDGP